MRERIKNAIQKATTLQQLEDLLIKELNKIKKETGHSWQYVSGIITSDGPDKVVENSRILDEHTRRIESMYGLPTLSATVVFDDLIFAQINADKIPYNNWLLFWRKILKSGVFETIHMTPRWEKSTGAKDELETAKELGLTVIYHQ